MVYYLSNKFYLRVNKGLRLKEMSFSIRGIFNYDDNFYWFV